jgi:uncharacterized protein with gpF-like domain
MTRREYKRRWLIDYQKYERKGLSVFRKGLKNSALNIPFDSINTNNFEILIRMYVLENEINQAYFDFYLNIGIAHGKKVGKAINKEETIKNFEPSTFQDNYREFIARWILNNAGARITSVREELIEYLIAYIAKGVEEGKDIRTISRELQKHILSRGFYRWQIERIVRTETAAAANLGAIQAGEASNVIWEKEWISSKDGRTRRRPDDRFDHYEIDGLRVAKGEPFRFQGDELQYPGDPKGQAGNVINCRCTVAIVPKRDENGRIIFTNRQQLVNN